MFILIFSRGHWQRLSPSQISGTPWEGFEPAQNLSSGFVELSHVIVITTLPRFRIRLWLVRNGLVQLSPITYKCSQFIQIFRKEAYVLLSQISYNEKLIIQKETACIRFNYKSDLVAYLEPCQTSNMERFGKMVNG